MESIELASDIRMGNTIEQMMNNVRQTILQGLHTDRQSDRKLH